MDVLRGFGTSYGEHTVYTVSYDALYAFEECAPGSRHELLWRILLRQTFHEGMALDNLALEVRERRDLQQTALADVFGYLLADELLHVESGLRWSRSLCGGDPRRAMEARAAAHSAFVRVLERRRADYVERDLGRAMAEVEGILDRIRRSQQAKRKKSVNREARRAAGYLEEEIEQVLGWGYVVEP